MNNVVLTKQSTPSQIEQYFRGVLALDEQERAKVLKSKKNLHRFAERCIFAAFNKPDEELYALPFYSVGHFFCNIVKRYMGVPSLGCIVMMQPCRLVWGIEQRVMVRPLIVPYVQRSK